MDAPGKYAPRAEPVYGEEEHALAMAEMEAAGLDALRAMSPERKLRAAAHLYYAARELKAAAFRAQHPEWSEAEVKAAVLEVFMYARS